MEQVKYIDQNYARKMLKPRPKDAHKGQCGHVLVIAGSKGMIGAAMLVAMGALRSGAGLVKLAMEEEFFPIVHSTLPEAICISRKLNLQELNDYDAIAMGPGLEAETAGIEEALETANMALAKMVLETDRPTIVMDAGGLDCLKLIGAKAVRSSTAAQKGNLIITPHPGEAARLLQLETQEINKNRMRSALDLSKKYGAISVLKGHESIITKITDLAATTGFSAEQFINTSGNPGMATAGSGDVLTGIITGFAAQAYTPIEAGLLGTYVHGAAGDMGAQLLGEQGLIASDIASMTGLAIKKIITDTKEIKDE